VKCDYCADDIRIDEEYFHFPNLDLNYHIDCRLPNNLMLENKRLIKEADDDTNSN
jgi:hypothetical protein